MLLRLWMPPDCFHGSIEVPKLIIFFAKRVRNNATDKIPGSSLDLNPRPSGYYLPDGYYYIHGSENSYIVISTYNHKSSLMIDCCNYKGLRATWLVVLDLNPSLLLLFVLLPLLYFVHKHKGPSGSICILLDRTHWFCTHTYMNQISTLGHSCLMDNGGKQSVKTERKESISFQTASLWAHRTLNLLQNNHDYRKVHKS